PRRAPGHRPRGQVRHGPRRARRARGHDARRRRPAGAGAEPVQAGLRLGRPPPRHGPGHGNDPAHRRVLVRPVPESKEELLPHGTTVQMKEGNIKKIFWQTPPLHLPRDWERRTRSLGEQLEALSVPELVERERSQGPEGALAAIECHRCPWGSQSRCDHSWKGVEALEGRLGQKREMLDAFKNAYWQEFCRVVAVLERFGAVQDGKLLAKGQLISGLR